MCMSQILNKMVWEQVKVVPFKELSEVEKKKLEVFTSKGVQARWVTGGIEVLCSICLVCNAFTNNSAELSGF